MECQIELFLFPSNLRFFQCIYIVNERNNNVNISAFNG